MKLFYVATFCLLGCFASVAQVKKQIEKTKVQVPTRLLKTRNDSISYAAGMSQVRMLKSLHTYISIFMADKAIGDSLSNQRLLFSNKTGEKILEQTSKRTKDSTTIGGIGDLLQSHLPFSLADSVSYAFGLYAAGTFAGDYGIKTLNYNVFNKSIEDGVANKPLLLTILQSRQVLSNIYHPEYLSNLQVSNKFIAENRNKPGVITLPDGLQYMILKAGTGPNITLTDSVSAHYKGTLANGTQFDSSYDRGQPLKLIDITKVIAGWTEGLQLMNLGAKYRFFIPPNLAYGSRHRSDIIVPYSALIFDVEVVTIGDRSL